LADGGAAGVQAALSDLTTDLVETMRLCGAADLAALTRDLIAPGRT
jgi:isopentenyl diphosphate isomerase/L-lactate dehydrogenase-like FMN-dependent dehydrogenase